MPATPPTGALTVAVVGAGIAGTACARALAAGGAAVTVLDRGRGVGGRMFSPRIEGRPVDLGASYLTADDPAFRAVVDDWVRRGLARPWTDAFHTAGPDGIGDRKPGPVRYGAAGGLRSLVEDLAGGLDVTVREVTHVGPGPSVDGQAYDAVVLAMPDPQALELLDPSLSGPRRTLEGRQWEPVLALAAGFAERTWAFDGCFVSGSALSWVADDGSRRGDGAPVLVAHSTPQAARLDEPALVTALRGLLGLPGPRWTRVQRWAYAKPVGRRDAPYLLADGVGLCGDGWGASKVQAAWLSGDALGRALLVG